jgi:hypothetical protein
LEEKGPKRYHCISLVSFFFFFFFFSLRQRKFGGWVFFFFFFFFSFWRETSQLSKFLGGDRYNFFIIIILGFKIIFYELGGGGGPWPQPVPP